MRHMLRMENLPMLKKLTEQLASHGYWFERIGLGNTIILNTQEPSASPANEDLMPGRGIVMSVQSMQGAPPAKDWLLAKWADDDTGYDEIWEFPSVSKFMKFFDKFMTDGIDGV